MASIESVFLRRALYVPSVFETPLRHAGERSLESFGTGVTPLSGCFVELFATKTFQTAGIAGASFGECESGRFSVMTLSRGDSWRARRPRM